MLLLKSRDFSGFSNNPSGRCTQLQDTTTFKLAVVKELNRKAGRFSS
jgi:hypothetical protein